jgi:hypothetical protein
MHGGGVVLLGTEYLKLDHVPVRDEVVYFTQAVHESRQESKSSSTSSTAVSGTVT